MQKTGPNENCDMTHAIRRRSNCKRVGFHSHRKLNLLLKEACPTEKACVTGGSGGSVGTNGCVWGKGEYVEFSSIGGWVGSER